MKSGLNLSFEIAIPTRILRISFSMRLFMILDERGGKMKLFSKTYLRDILMIKVSMLCRLTLDVHSHQGSFSSLTPSWVALLPRGWGYWALGPTAWAPHEPDPITIIKTMIINLNPGH
jgi:hypothetical protein